EELARRLGVSVADIHRDLEELRARSDYHLAGLGDDIQVVALDRERVELWTKGLLQRPVRLSPREALALDLGLRALERQQTDAASEDPSPDEALSAVRKRLLEALAAPTGPAGAPADPASLRLADLESPIPREVERAAVDGGLLRILYRAPGRTPAPRTVAPRELVRAEGAWYLLAFDPGRDDLRAFRLDRVLEARALPDEAPAPTPAESRRLAELVEDGAVFGPSAQEDLPRATVRYDASIARWIRERGWPRTREEEDGSLLVEHDVADPNWLVEHVLGYGGAARVLDPPELAGKVAEAASRVARLHEGNPAPTPEPRDPPGKLRRAGMDPGKDPRT
ncbi:MAG: WYL domain-containing protein, partial [Gemmatimonadales bacterium]